MDSARVMATAIATELPTLPPETYPTEPEHEHAFTIKQKTVEPTCINMGYTIYKCECGNSDIDDFVDPVGHEYGEPEAWQLFAQVHWH